MNLTNNKKNVSIVVPCFNEGSNIISFYETVSLIISTIKNINFSYFFIDDGSSDHTLDELFKLLQKDPSVNIVELSRNYGKEAALTAGINEATGDALIVMDADLQDPPELIEQLVNKWLEGFEVVLARRVDRSADSFLKRKSAALFYSVHNKLSDTKIPNNVGDFRLIDRIVVDAIKKLPEQQRFMKGLFAWVGFKTTAVDYTRQKRFSGKTKFSAWKLWKLALEGITSFSSFPLKLWTYIGLFSAFSSFLYLLYIFFIVLIRGVDVPGYASLVILLLFFNSLNLISTGILGEYIGRIYVESKNRPIYLIRKKYNKNES